MNKLPTRARVYVIFVIGTAIAFGYYLANNYGIEGYGSLLLFVLLSFIAESMAVPLPGEGGAVSVGYAVNFAAMVILGPLPAALSSSIGIAFRYVKLPNNRTFHIFNTPFYKILFNGAQCFLSIGIPSVVYYSFGISTADPTFYTRLFPLILALITYLIINTSIITKLFSILNKQSFWSMFVNNIKWTLPNSFVIGTLGIFISILYINYGSIIMLLFFGPLLLARHSFKLYIDMKNLYMETVYALTKAVEAKDPYTNGHSLRVAEYSEKLAIFMKLPQNKISTLKTAAMLHDIGKIGIEDYILNKPAKLTDEEFTKIKDHPVIGVNILSDVDFLSDVKQLIIKHHERYDGRGYPAGISGDIVPIEAYILSVADAFDAMTSDRSYRKGMTTEEAIGIISKEAGFQFHPTIAEKFIIMLEKELKEQESLAVTK